MNYPSMLRSDNPAVILPRYMTRPWRRQLRLFACACVRRAWHLVTDERSRNVVAVTERYADGNATGRELRAARAAANDAVRPDWDPAGASAVCVAATHNYGEISIAAGLAARALHPNDLPGVKQERIVQCDLLRDLLGKPRRLRLPDQCRTSNTIALANAMYDGRDFAAMPILGDALEDAGCGNARILEHCRAHPFHARGCWVVDWLTGRE